MTEYVEVLDYSSKEKFEEGLGESKDVLGVVLHDHDPKGAALTEVTAGYCLPLWMVTQRVLEK